MGLSLSREHHAIFVVLCHSILLLALVWGFLCQGSITPFLSSFVIPFFCWRLYGAFFVKGASRHFCRPLSFHSFVGACMGLSLSREHHAIFVVLCHSILLLALVWGFLCQGSITPFLSSFVIPFFCWRFFSAAEGLSLTEASTAAGSPAIGWLAAR